MPKRSSVADTAMTIGTSNIAKNDIIVFQIYLGQFIRSSFIFEGSFEELDILNDTRMLLYHKNWTLRDYQPNERNDYEDVSRPIITTYEQKEQLGFFYLKQNN